MIFGIPTLKFAAAVLLGLIGIALIGCGALLNYAFGVTDVRLRDYVLASWIGMAPGTVLYVYIGSLAGDLAKIGSGAPARTPAGWALYGAGLLATAAVSVYITRIARAALAADLPVAPSSVGPAGLPPRRQETQP